MLEVAVTGPLMAVQAALPDLKKEKAEVARERVRADVSGSDFGARTAGQRTLFGDR